MFIADDLGAWLISLFADRVRRNLTALVLGDELDRALRSAATAAIELTAAELCPDDSQAAMVINEVFGTPVADTPFAQHTTTLLRALQTGIAEQLAVLDDASLTGTSQSSAQGRAADVRGATPMARAGLPGNTRGVPREEVSPKVRAAEVLTHYEPGSIT